MRTLIVMACAAICFSTIMSPEQERTSASPARKYHYVHVHGEDAALKDNTPTPAPPAPATPVPDPAPMQKEPVKAEIDPTCDCDCCKQLSDVKARLAVVESRYGTSSSGGGSTGKPKATGYGSTDSAVKGYGSAGSAASAPPVVTYYETVTATVTPEQRPTPVRNFVANVFDPSPRWYNKDGMSRGSHLEVTHGISTAGMTPAEIQAEQNAYHDAFGPDHPVRGVKMSGTPTSAPPLAPADNSCPGGYYDAQGNYKCPNNANARAQRSVLESAPVTGQPVRNALKRIFR